MRVVVLGGGYAGVALTRRLERALPEEVALTLIDDTGEHVIQHQLHRLVRFPDLDDHLRIPLEELFDRATVVEARVEGVDGVSRSVSLSDRASIEPDILAICLGAVTADRGVSGVMTYGQPLKRIEHAWAIRDAFLSRDPGDRVVIGGAGLSGVQVAGELAALNDELGIGVDLVLVEQSAAIAPGYPDEFRRVVRATLEEAGVMVRTGETITRVSARDVELTDEGNLAYDQLIWTGGITGPPAMDGTRVPVRSDLRVGERTVALGDAARVVDDRGEAVPASAQTAVRQSETAAVNVARLAEADSRGSLVFEPRLARYVDTSPGWVVSVGDDAVALLGEQVVRGTPAKVVKTTVWAKYLSSIGRIRQSLDVIAEEIGWPQYEDG